MILTPQDTIKMIEIFEDKWDDDENLSEEWETKADYVLYNLERKLEKMVLSNQKQDELVIPFTIKIY